MIRSGSKHWRRRLGETAPIFALTIMLLLPMVFALHIDDADLILQRNAEVQAAVNDMPYRLDDWVGEDVEVPASAVEILHPNAILSRRFRKLSGGASLHLLVVHCSDARDMQGHYPPVCYPANGWIQITPGENDQIATMTVLNETISVRYYNFLQMTDWGGEQSIRVFNYFLLPDGTITIDLALVNRLVERSIFSVQGVTQVQLVMTGNPDLEVSRVDVENLLNAASPLLSRLGQGKKSQG